MAVLGWLGEVQFTMVVKVYYSEAWHTVCDDGWSLDDASVVCKQLGYSGVISVHSSAAFGEGSGGILLDDLSCNGREGNLLECSHRGIGSHNCGHHEDAGVTCELYIYIGVYIGMVWHKTDVRYVYIYSHASQTSLCILIMTFCMLNSMYMPL